MINTELLKNIIGKTRKEKGFKAGEHELVLTGEKVRKLANATVAGVGVSVVGAATAALGYVLNEPDIVATGLTCVGVGFPTSLILADKTENKVSEFKNIQEGLHDQIKHNYIEQEFKDECVKEGLTSEEILDKRLVEDFNFRSGQFDADILTYERQSGKNYDYRRFMSNEELLVAGFRVSKERLQIESSELDAIRKEEFELDFENEEEFEVDFHSDDNANEM